MDKTQEIEARLTAIEEAIRSLGNGPSLDNLNREMDRAANRAKKEKDKPAAAAAVEAQPAAEQQATPKPKHH